MRLKIIRHLSCVILGWILGPFLAAWMAEAMVGLGFRGDFTLLDIFWRLLLIGAFELAWFYASHRTTELPTNPR